MFSLPSASSSSSLLFRCLSSRSLLFSSTTSPTILTFDSCRQLTSWDLSVYGNIFSVFRRQFDDNSRRFYVTFICSNSSISDKSLKQFRKEQILVGNKQKTLSASRSSSSNINNNYNYCGNHSRKFSTNFVKSSICRPPLKDFKHKKGNKMASAPKVKLNNGMEMPVLGLGTYMAKDDEGEIAVKHAIDCGYRHIDTAYFYQNEEQVGKAIRDKINEGVIKREDIFVVTKLWNIFHAKDKVEYACRKSLNNLGLDYIDLYLMHLPVGYKYVDDDTLLPKDESGKLLLSNVDYLETYKAMEELVKLGLVKSIGISNFNSEQIERVLQNCEIKPVTNQVECSPALNQKKLIQFCKERDITLTAYSPLGRPNPTEEKPDFIYSDKTAQLSAKYNKTPAQIVLRYLIDIGTIPIPKSSNKQRIEENFNVFDFKLDEEDITVMDSFNTGDRLVPFPLIRAQDHKYYPFKIEY